MVRLDIKEIVKDSINSTRLREKIKDLREAYVSTPKTFNQTSEMVSEQTKKAHYDLYQKYIDSLNDVSRKLDTVSLSEVNPMHDEFMSLKRDEAYNSNAKWLHELYFANCFDPNSTIYMNSLSYMRLQRDYGTFDTWQKDFVACCKACGEGWAVCGYNLQLKRYVNTVINDHSSNVMLGLYPVIVVDMWSHAYFRDRLNDKESYVTAMMKEFNWSIIEERVQKAESFAEVIK